MSLWEQSRLPPVQKPSMLNRFMPVLALVALCWVTYAINNLLLGGHLNRFGILPRQLAGLPGIFLGPFLHGSFKHLLANTVPLLVLGAIICGRSRSEFGIVVAAGIVIGGGLTWLFARSAYHIGASGLVFCLFGYLASLAFFRRTFGALLISAVCILGYGGILRGILPGSAAVSWEGHLAGLAAGILLAWVASKVDRAKKDSKAAPQAAGVVD